MSLNVAFTNTVLSERHDIDINTEIENVILNQIFGITFKQLLRI